MAPAASSHDVPWSDEHETNMSKSREALVGAAGMGAGDGGEVGGDVTGGAGAVSGGDAGQMGMPSAAAERRWGTDCGVEAYLRR